MSAIAQPNLCSHPTGQSEPRTEILAAPGEETFLDFDIPKVPYPETTDQYQSVNLSAREPLLTATEVSRQMVGAGEMLGSLLAKIDLPSLNAHAMDKATIRMNALPNRVYVFGRPSYGGKLEYTILGSETLGRIEDGFPSPEGAIVHMSEGDPELIVGSAKGNWLPSSGFAGQSNEAPRTVSRTQGRFVVDQRGDLHYEEAMDRKNPSNISMKQTLGERFRDSERVEQEALIEKGYEEATQDRTELGAAEYPHMPLHEQQVDLEDRHRMKRRTRGGRLVGERYKGTHRRLGILGRLASQRQ